MDYMDFFIFSFSWIRNSNSHFSYTTTQLRSVGDKKRARPYDYQYDLSYYSILIYFIELGKRSRIIAVLKFKNCQPRRCVNAAIHHAREIESYMVFNIFKGNMHVVLRIRLRSTKSRQVHSQKYLQQLRQTEIILKETDILAGMESMASECFL